MLNWIIHITYQYLKSLDCEQKKSSCLFENITNKLFPDKSHTHQKKDLALNHTQGLICHDTTNQPNNFLPFNVLLLTCIDTHTFTQQWNFIHIFSQI